MAKMYLTVEAVGNGPQLVRDLKADDDRSVNQYISDLFAEVPQNATELEALVTMYAWRELTSASCEISAERGDMNETRDVEGPDHLYGGMTQDGLQVLLGTLDRARIPELVREGTDLYVEASVSHFDGGFAGNKVVTENKWAYEEFNGVLGAMKLEQYGNWQTERMEQYQREKQ